MEDGDLVLEYQRFWQLAQLNDELKIRRALFIGAGAFGMPEQVARLGAGRARGRGRDRSRGHRGRDGSFSSSTSSRMFTRMRTTPGVSSSARDEKYDFIFGDAYNGVQAHSRPISSRASFLRG